MFLHLKNKHRQTFNSIFFPLPKLKLVFISRTCLWTHTLHFRFVNRQKVTGCKRTALQNKGFRTLSFDSQANIWASIPMTKRKDFPTIQHENRARHFLVSQQRLLMLTTTVHMHWDTIPLCSTVNTRNFSKLKLPPTPNRCPCFSSPLLSRHSLSVLAIPIFLCATSHIRRLTNPSVDNSRNKSLIWDNGHNSSISKYSCDTWNAFSCIKMEFAIILLATLIAIFSAQLFGFHKLF